MVDNFGQNDKSEAKKVLQMLASHLLVESRQILCLFFAHLIIELGAHLHDGGLDVLTASAAFLQHLHVLLLFLTSGHGTNTGEMVCHTHRHVKCYQTTRHTTNTLILGRPQGKFSIMNAFPYRMNGKKLGNIIVQF